jgi:LmbE family N-acetylglucosaminyl deacetylase
MYQISNLSRVLVFAAHQDDEAIGCGATLKKLSNLGIKVRVVFITNGKTGVSPGNLELKEQIVSTRMKEAKEAAKILGISELKSLDFECQKVDSKDQELFHKVIQEIRSFKPQIVITHNTHDNHRDHRSISEVVVEACWKSKEAIHVELGDMHEVTDVWGMEVVDPHKDFDFVIDVSDTIQSKIKSMKVYSSQLEIVDGIFDYMSGLSKVRGYSIGVTAGEAFKRLSINPAKVVF